MTTYPVELLWGPGRWDYLEASLSQFSDDAPLDQVFFFDRIFYVRVTPEGGVEFPRTGTTCSRLSSTMTRQHGTS